MKMTFRWYGEKDCIPLQYIRQIPNMSGVVTAVYDTPVGEVWEEEKIARLKALCEKEGLAMEVIESVPVHEDIKLGKPSRDRLIANYAQTIRNLGKYGVKCICYNFMPVFDWFRTDLHYRQENGSDCLAYRQSDFEKLDNIFFCLFVIEKVRPVQMTERMKNAFLILGTCRDNEPFSLPVIQIFGGIQPHAPRPHFVLARGVFLVFADPIIGIVFKEKLCAVRLNALPVRVIPGFSGRNAVVHVTPPNRPKIRRPRG